MKKGIILILSWLESRICWSHELKFRSAAWHSHWPTFTHFITNELFRTDKAECIANKFRKQNLLLCRKMSKAKGLYFNLCYFNLAEVLLEKNGCRNTEPSEVVKNHLEWLFKHLFQAELSISAYLRWKWLLWLQDRHTLLHQKTASMLHIHAI